MNTQPSPNPKPVVTKNDEIDLLELAKIFWNGRKTILKTILYAAVIGLVIAFLSPKEYTAKTIMVPQTSQTASKLGGLSSLAAMAGFNLDMNSTGDDVTPLVYPQIISSTPFELELMNTPFSFSEIDHPASLFEYYIGIANQGILSMAKKYTIGLPGLIFSAIKGKKETVKTEGNGPISLTEDQEKVRKIIADKLNLDLDTKQGFLTLTASFPEALLSAQVVEKARQMLQKYITQYKINKASDQLTFIEQRYQEKKGEFEKVQDRLARFRDQNKNVTSSVVQTEEERLQSEYSIAMNVYNELAKQLEQAKIQVKEDTPVFSVLEPAVVPQEKSKPKRALILIIWFFLGGIIGTGIVFGREFTKDLGKQWKELN
jgi:capsular polysaccharide biosynthesis protein